MSMKNPRILIIEDDEDIRELCQILLIKAGFTVETCVNGLEALIALQKHDEPCLILLDMMMPIMNGREFMAAFTKKPHTIVPIPVYLVSATGDKNDGKEMGCLGFLKKPFDCDALLAIVDTHCKSRYLNIALAKTVGPQENLSSQHVAF
ncbi:MAG: response regulator [Moraxellaceae bacterium]|nr:response regulator [Pseudobdellovibrionaceae bacterium]